MSFWIGRVDAGASLQDMATDFIASQEFRNLSANANDNNSLTTLLYSNVLNRAPDQGGLAFWAGQLEMNARDQGGVLTSFSESPENVN
ncbi:MAG: DUF4214 domain-containing protein [Pseudomonadota bacterium]